MKIVIAPLTGIRSIFALLVLVFHCMVNFPGSRLVSAPLMQSGYIGVDGFFILSGFILAHVHGAEMRNPSPRIIRAFFVARFARIYPLHLLTLSAFAASLGIGFLMGFHSLAPERYGLASTVANLLLVHAWVGLGATWDTTSWTISCEFAAYLAFPLLAFVASRQRSAVFVAIAVAIFVICEWGFRTDQYTNPAKIFPEFVLGMALYRLPAIKPRLADGAALAAGASALVAMVLGALPLAVTLFAGMIACLRDARGPFASAMGSRVMQYLGENSYALYLWQGVTFLIVRHGSEKLGILTGDTASSVAAVILTFVVAVLSHHLFEVPARRFIRTHWSRPPVGEAQLARP